jgi:hypothetical protein
MAIATTAPLGGSARWQAGFRFAGVAALGGLALAAVLLVLGALAPGSLIVEHQHGVGRHILGVLHGLPTIRLTAARYVLLLVGMSACYVVVLACARSIPPRLLVGGAMALVALLAIAPPLLSTDIFSYVAYSRLGLLHHLNPYVHGPAAAPHDAVYRYVGVTWLHTPNVYGPLFTIATYPLAKLGVVGAMWVLKIVAGASTIAMLALVGRAASRLGRSAPVAIAFVGLNPLLLVYTVGGGHNDLIMLALMVLGMTLALEGRLLGAMVAMAAGAAVKLTGGASLALAALALGRRAILGAVLGVALMAILGFAVFGSHALDFVHALTSEQRHMTSTESTPNELAKLFGLGGATSGVRIAASVILAGGLLAIAAQTWRGRLHWIDATGWALVLATVTTMWLQAWYVCWSLPFAALSRDRLLQVASLLVGALFLAHRLPLVVA